MKSISKVKKKSLPSLSLQCFITGVPYNTSFFFNLLFYFNNKTKQEAEYIGIRVTSMLNSEKFSLKMVLIFELEKILIADHGLKRGFCRNGQWM